MKTGTKVLINKTDQTAVVVASKVRLIRWKFVRCYEVMYQLPDKKMNIVGSLEYASLTEKAD